ncbi:JmjC domain-containing protein [Tanacetum coccineum]|uniref:JmjC domain-containing protein n=1 Tax=Tanacetum coccineum TaxID=301880 RepID=A0ABQ5CDC2_9ASTR
MLPLLSYQKLTNHIDGTTAPSATIASGDQSILNPAFTSWNDFDQRAVILLNSSITEEAAAEVLGLTTAHAIWTALETTYSNSSVERIHSLRDSLRNLSKGTSTISDYGRQFKGICDKLAAIEQPVDEMDKLHCKLFANMRLNFVGDHMPLLDAMLPPAQAAIADEGAHASDPDLFTSTNVEDETLRGSFHTTPPRSTPVPPVGPTSGGAEDLATLTALSSLVSELVQKVSTLESELRAHKLLFKDVVGQLVKKVKALELKLKTRSRKAAAALDAHVAVSPGATIPPSPPLSTSDVPTTEVPSTEFPTDVPSDGAPTGPLTISPGRTTAPTSNSISTSKIIPASSGTTPEIPSSPVRDARKGKGIAVEAPTPNHDNTFKQLEEERLGCEAAQRLQAQETARGESLMKDANLARQMSQDFEMTEAQRKRQQEVLASAANYSNAAWDIILARLQANPDLSSTIFGVEFTDDDFAARMVELVNTRRKELAEQRAQERRERPMTPSQLMQYMRTYVKNQGPAIYSTG